MAETFIPVRSVKNYIREFGVEAIGKQHAKPEMVKQQILDAFHKEIFGQFVAKFGRADMLAMDIHNVDPETKTAIDNILSNSVRKWKRLCIEFDRFKETYKLLRPSDLMITLEDIVKVQTGESEVVDGEEAEGVSLFE